MASGGALSGVAAADNAPAVGGAALDATLTAAGMAADPEVGVPLAAVTHPRSTVEVVLVAMLVVLTLLALAAPYFVGARAVAPLFWAGAAGCGLAAWAVGRRRPRKGAPKLLAN